MKFITFSVIGAAMLGLTACDTMTPSQQSAAGAVGGEGLQTDTGPGDGPAAR